MKKNSIILMITIISIILLLLSIIVILKIKKDNNIIVNVSQERKAQIESEMETVLADAITILKTENENATLDDITQTWIDESIQDYENTVILDASISGKKIIMKKSGVIGKFVLDEELDIIERDIKTTNIEFEYITKMRKDEKAVILMTIQDKVAGIEKVELLEKGTIINANLKEKISIDYEIEFGKEYKVKITSGDGTEQEETILMENYYYTITKNLGAGITVDNIVAIKAGYNEPYQATITVNEDYRIDTISVTMGENAIAVDKATGKINIEKVTGDIKITVTTVIIKIVNINTSQTDPEGAKPANATVLYGDASIGIVIQDSKGNEWTWVEVPKSVTASATTDAQIETALKNYASAYKANSWEHYKEAYYDKSGMTQAQYNTSKSKMLQSIKTYGGFWISRYEIGNSSGTAVSKINQIPYYNITCSSAQSKASGMSTDSTKTSSLLFGIQWDLTCKFLEKTTTQYYIKTNSATWGNYASNTLKLVRGKYNGLSNASLHGWTDYNVNSNWATSGIKKNTAMLTTGASEQTKKMNIYDFAGNFSEWTLENYAASYGMAIRGGEWQLNNESAAYRRYSTGGTDGIGFRVTIY